MAITREEVRHIALLARLQLSAAEEEAFTEQLDHILSHLETLQQLDTTNVEPTAHVVAMATPFREDRVSNTPDTEALLANAPVRDARFFKVPKIIE
jgi:aspartyl-tRNA(Asn)/glutamyl-tRNA(Gln) amidotransferase subunit C